MRRVLLVALVALAACVPAAQAKLLFADTYNRTFTPGELLELHTQYRCDAFCSREVGGKLAALTPMTRGVGIRGLCAARRWPLAEVTRGGRLSFVVPDVPTGRYQIVVRYVRNPKMPCAWGAMSQPFRVVGSGD
jgi:hypothetical protein